MTTLSFNKIVHFRRGVCTFVIVLIWYPYSNEIDDLMAKADKNYIISPENMLTMTFTKPCILLKRNVARNPCSHSKKKIVK